MTREEAIDYNKNLRMYMRLSDKNQPCKFLEENYIALDMAIKALEQEPCEDAVPYIYYDDVTKSIKGMPSVKPQLICENERKENVRIMQDELISRQAVRHILNHEIKMPIKVWKKLFELVDDLPPITPQQKMGHWIYKQYGSYPEQGDYHCSECDGIDNRIPAYCPNCGTKMQEVEE